MKCLSQQSLRANQLFVFFFTFLCYAAVHSTRTAWSVSKTDFQKRNDYSKQFLGWIDFIFLFSYAMSLKIGGGLGDRFNLRYFLSLGMIFASVFLTLVAVLGLSNHDNKPSFLIFMSLNGIFQSTAWPGLLATMGNWFGKGNRGLMMGIWSANSNIGNIIGQQMGQITIDMKNWGWEYCLLASSVFLFSMGLLVLLFLEPYPEKAQISSSPDIERLLVQNNNAINQGQESTNSDQTQNNQNVKKINYFTAWLVPGVPLYALSYACLKSASYGLLFWLPNYLQNQNLNSYSYTISSMNDIGSFVGGVFTGYISDRLGRRALCMFPQLIISGFLMAIVRFLLMGESPIWYYFVIFFIGVLLGGPYNIISAAISIELAKQPALQKQKSAISTISSLIEGMGSLCAAILQIVIPQFKDEQTFIIFMVLTFGSVFFQIPMIISDIKDVLKSKENNVIDESEVQKQIHN